MVRDRISEGYRTGLGTKTGELEAELKFKSVWAWMWYKLKVLIYKYLPALTIILVVILIILAVLWTIANWSSLGIIGTRTEAGLEKSGVPGRIAVGLRDVSQRIENWVLGFGEWKSPGAKEEKIPKGIKILEFAPRKDLPYRTGEPVEATAEVKVYALDSESFGTSSLFFYCEYDGGEKGQTVIDGIETDESYIANNQEKTFDVRCVLPAVETAEEVITNKINFYASYTDFETVSTLYVSVLGEDEYTSRESDGTLLDFLKKNSAHSNLIGGDRKATSTYTNGPVKLALTTGKLPLTENRLYSVGISYTPEISEWTGNIKLKSLELSKLPDVFSITKCDYEAGGLWSGDDLDNCDDSCQRICDFNVRGVDEFLEYEIKARARYDYAVKATSTVTIRNV